MRKNNFAFYTPYSDNLCQIRNCQDKGKRKCIKTIDDIINQNAGRILDSFDIKIDLVETEDVVAEVDGSSVKAQINGVIRGILRDGTEVWKGMKAEDIDPRGRKDFCYSVSEKTLAFGGGVLEGILL